ncbi:glycosyltransferase family 2 protein [Algibacter mikhailovii]|uniref:Glycosyl transferase n=1 Tax=Algibacter mikhailovii TaxID=425498 RepID=A0A918V550_9FLAO|nr:glycosyltransferase family 2 protein [Algibacter mikhailovii]GGZ72044.1 glycosyl transferase [Algibacter mikhailovii]
MTLKTSLIISTYNWPEALELVLQSVAKQKVLPYEIIVADDGSTNTTEAVIKDFQECLSVPLIHVWHADNGFKKAVILNKAIALAIGEYIIQTDGDCILHPSFVKDHIEFAEKNTYLFGSRVNIQKNYLQKLFSRKQVCFSVFSSGIKKRTRALHCTPMSKLYKKTPVFSKKFRGCNVSFYKNDFIAVNGYNEDFEGWGKEDSELARRFHNYGLEGRRLRYRAIIYHIFHLEKSLERFELNSNLEDTTIKQHLIWCTNGINKHLSEK